MFLITQAGMICIFRGGRPQILFSYSHTTFSHFYVDSVKTHPSHYVDIRYLLK